MAKYRVQHLGRTGNYPANYHYAIWRDDEQIAEYFHDYRNDERWIIVGGQEHTGIDALIGGGGPEPLEVTSTGEQLLDALLAG